ncbi:glycosyltransferase family 4 protein [Salinisphaera aquimarina]|uniref:Glycosyltransferase family 4 protein n=1 Tax=Salinisphaera aquimarina TaxID=2094031 RepID=A0ABV7EQS8_9GAMM
MKSRKRVLIIVENLPLPFDRRVWQEACALRDAGYSVSIICPTAPDYEQRYVEIEGIAIHRHPLPVEADSALTYALEYGMALFWQLVLATRIAFGRGFDVIHACNPPDTVFIVGRVFRLFGKRFIFDQHDLCPELYLAKFNRRDRFYRLMCLLERLTFNTARVSIATNDSFREIALSRGGMAPEDVFVVRSGPNLARLQPVPPNPALRHGRRYLVGYVGVMGKQEGLDTLLHIIADIVHQRAREDIQFCLVGFGTELTALRALAAELNLGDYVSFPGRLEGAELLEVLCTSDVCVSPDPHNAMNDKSTMNKIMEYMALGKASVQFDLAEGRFSAQQASLYAEPGNVGDFADKLLRLIDDAELRDSMGAYGQQRIAEVLDWQYEVPRLLAAYERALR